MKDKKIGIYYIGNENAELWVSDSTGGHFFSCPEKGMAKITVGLNQDKWWRVLNVVMHEAIEFAAFRHGCRFDPCDDMSRDYANYLFVMHHPQFSECVCRAAEFVAGCQNDLCKEWKAFKKLRQQS